MSHKILINKKKRAEDVDCCEQKYLLYLSSLPLQSQIMKEQIQP